MASRGVKPQPRGKPSGLPFHAKFTDVAARAGLRAPVIYGPPDHFDYVLESNGCGLAFLDFETVNPAIPAWKGCHPYEHVPVQMSCHVVGARGSLEHHEHLADGRVEVGAQGVDVVQHQVAPNDANQFSFEDTNLHNRIVAGFQLAAALGNLARLALRAEITQHIAAATDAQAERRYVDAHFRDYWKMNMATLLEQSA